MQKENFIWVDELQEVQMPYNGMNNFQYIDYHDQPLLYTFRDDLNGLWVGAHVYAIGYYKDVDILLETTEEEIQIINDLGLPYFLEGLHNRDIYYLVTGYLYMKVYKDTLRRVREVFYQDMGE